MNRIKLSHTMVNMYLSCSLCYKAHYIDKWRPKKVKSYFLFGSSLDTALNDLLINKDLNKSLAIFKDSWNNSCYNKSIDWLKSDLDQELLDHYKIEGNHKEYFSLLLKGQLMIEAYNKEVMPKIKEIVALQKPIKLLNKNGDEINGFLDAIIRKIDDKLYLVDNKSSGSKYSSLAPKEMNQLPLYNYIIKNEYDIEKAGYIVMMKKINKNKIKECKSCGAFNESSHKKCNAEIKHEVINEPRNFYYKRCNGEFNTTINPSCNIQTVFNKIEPEDEMRVLNNFDKVLYGIKNNIFEKGPPSKYGKCTYFDIHEENNTSEFYKK